MKEMKTADPFNWPMPSRDDLMSLNTISLEKDLFRVKTAGVTKRTRLFSQNLDTCDIEGNSLIYISHHYYVGAKPKAFIKEVINRPEF